MKYKVLITDPISDSGISILKNNNCDIIDCVNDNDKIDEIISEIDEDFMKFSNGSLSAKFKAAFFEECS